MTDLNTQKRAIATFVNAMADTIKNETDSAKMYAILAELSESIQKCKNL